jgi:hypothetical protein
MTDTNLSAETLHLPQVAHRRIALEPCWRAGCCHDLPGHTGRLDRSRPTSLRGRTSCYRATTFADHGVSSEPAAALATAVVPGALRAGSSARYLH